MSDPKLSEPKFTVGILPPRINLDPALSSEQIFVISRLAGEHGRCTPEERAAFRNTVAANFVATVLSPEPAAGPGRPGVNLDRMQSRPGNGLGNT